MMHVQPLMEDIITINFQFSHNCVIEDLAREADKKYCNLYGAFSWEH